MSAFTSVVRENLDPLVKADRCVDDIGIAAQTPEELITNLDFVFQQLDKFGLKLSMGKCEFGQKTNRVSMKDHFKYWHCSHRKTSNRLPDQIETPELCESTSTLPRFCKILQVVHLPSS